MRALLLACPHGGEVDVHLKQQEGASEVAEGVEEILQLHLLGQMVGETLMGPLAGEHL